MDKFVTIMAPHVPQIACEIPLTVIRIQPSLFFNICFIPSTNLSFSVSVIVLGGSGGLEGKYTKTKRKRAREGTAMENM